MQLIIAEKPSLGRNIVASIEEVKKDKLNKKTGYYEGEHYVVTWAFGHLFSLLDIEDYQNRGENEESRKDKFPRKRYQSESK